MGAEADLREGRGSVRLALVDDHDLAREGLRDMLADESDLEVVGEAANGREALALCFRVRPDLVMMDVRMPEMDGLEATRMIKQEFPKISVLILTMHENPDYLLEAIRAGAAGYVLKDAPQHEVITAIRQVLGGESPLDPELAARLLRRLAAEEGERREGLAQSGRGQRQEQYVESLTPREQEVLGLLKLGHTNREVARMLVISPGTAKNHVEHIIRKLGVSDRTQAVVRALELGILELSD
jgi:DNA-binding NarL/FixJ family response regulator